MIEFANEIGRMSSMQPHENIVLRRDDARKRRLHAWLVQLIRIAHGAACGLAHLHRLGIVHRENAHAAPPRPPHACLRARPAAENGVDSRRNR